MANSSIINFDQDNKFIILQLVLTGHSSLYLLHLYVSYTDIEIDYKPSDEEVTDSVGKLKLQLNKTYGTYLVTCIATVNVMLK